MRSAILLLLTLNIGTVLPAYGDVYQVLLKKQETKKENRWSLSDWLDTRDRMRMMDLWLALHSPSPYEFFVGGEYEFGNLGANFADASANTVSVYAGAYASIFGLEAIKRFRLNEWTAQGNLRIFGYHVQATNITLHAGVRSRTNPTTYLNTFIGLSTTLYLNKQFGLDGNFKYFFSAWSNTAGVNEFGHVFNLGLFVDFQFVRTYARYFSDSTSRSAGPATGQDKRSGLKLGVQLFY